MRCTQVPLLKLLLLAPLVGCGGEQPGEGLAGDQRWTVAVEPEVRIGGVDEREDYLLHRVVGATRLSDGRIAVANAGSAEISYYDSHGSHVMTVGGEGEGPGEFKGIIQMVRLPGDTILVLSIQPGLTWISPDGEYVRSERFSVWGIAQVPCRLGESNWHLLQDGSIVTVLEDNFYGSDCPPTPASPWRQTGLIARSTLYDGQFDTVGILPATERNSPNYRVFGRSLVVAFGGDRVFAGDTGAEEILVLGFNGDTLQALPVPFETSPIPSEAKVETVRRFTYPDGTVEIGEPYLYPEEYPRFGRLVADETGALWVMNYPRLLEPISSYRLARAHASLVEDGGARWLVLGDRGQALAEVRTPPGVFPLEIGEDYILGLSKDEFDVETVLIHTLAR